MEKNKLKGIVFILIGAIFFGAQGIFSVLAINTHVGSTIQVAYLKLFYGLIAIIILNIFFGKLKLQTFKNIFKKGNRLNMLISTLSVVGVNVFIMLGYSKVGAALGIVYLYSSIFYTVFLSKWISKEKITLNKVMGGILVVLGLIVVYLGGNTDGAMNILGVAMCLLAGLSMSFYNIFAKRSLKTFSTLNHNMIQLTLGFMMLSIFVNPSIIVHTITMPQNYWVIIIGVLVFGVAYPIFGKGLSMVDSGISGIIASSEIIYSAILAFIIFNNKLSLLQMFGLGLVTAAIVINSLNFQSIRAKHIEKKRLKSCNSLAALEALANIDSPKE